MVLMMQLIFVQAQSGEYWKKTRPQSLSSLLETNYSGALQSLHKNLLEINDSGALHKNLKAWVCLDIRIIWHQYFEGAPDVSGQRAMWDAEGPSLCFRMLDCVSSILLLHRTLHTCTAWDLNSRRKRQWCLKCLIILRSLSRREYPLQLPLFRHLQ